ncbi:MAG: hypothetical protein K2X01_05245 [Cyanobacteria bacterium]|nr:hypothetical protein [Cyanobacteriota bacterium]
MTIHSKSVRFGSLTINATGAAAASLEGAKKITQPTIDQLEQEHGMHFTLSEKPVGELPQDTVTLGASHNEGNGGKALLLSLTAGPGICDTQWSTTQLPALGFLRTAFSRIQQQIAEHGGLSKPIQVTSPFSLRATTFPELSETVSRFRRAIATTRESLAAQLNFLPAEIKTERQKSSWALTLPKPLDVVASRELAILLVEHFSISTDRQQIVVFTTEGLAKTSRLLWQQAVSENQTALIANTRALSGEEKTRTPLVNLNPKDREPKEIEFNTRIAQERKLMGIDTLSPFLITSNRIDTPGQNSRWEIYLNGYSLSDETVASLAKNTEGDVYPLSESNNHFFAETLEGGAKLIKQIQQHLSQTVNIPDTTLQAERKTVLELVGKFIALRDNLPSCKQRFLQQLSQLYTPDGDVLPVSLEFFGETMQPILRSIDWASPITRAVIKACIVKNPATESGKTQLMLINPLTQQIV